MEMGWASRPRMLVMVSCSACTAYVVVVWEVKGSLIDHDVHVKFWCVYVGRHGWEVGVVVG